jgi:hypothetical protein
VYRSTQELEVPAEGSITEMTTWLAGDMPGSYRTVLSLDGIPHATINYEVQADDTPFASDRTDSPAYQAGETVTVFLEVTNSAFALTDPGSAAVTEAPPDGSAQALGLSHPAAGQYEGQYTAVLSGTYVVEAKLSSSENQVVDDTTCGERPGN